MRRALAGIGLPLLLLGCNAASSANSGIFFPFPVPGASEPTSLTSISDNCVSPTLAPGTWWASPGSLHITVVDWQGHPEPGAVVGVAQEPSAGQCSDGLPYTTDASGSVTVDHLVPGKDVLALRNGDSERVTVIANQTTDVTLKQSMPSPEPSFAVSPSPVEPSERKP
ncbi:MAG TPA: hypothetical protein V6D47_21915 [Oscillatoriaceae cyanobacterium]